MNDNDKLIQNQFNSLPVDVKESISRIPWRERVRDIAKREGLDADKSLALETETMMILFGFQSADDYTKNILTQVEIDEETAERITKEVSDEILTDIEKQFEMIDAISHKNTIEVPKITQVPTNQQPPATVSPASTQNPSASSSIEVAPNNLPEIVPGQTAHNVPHVESTITPAEPKPIVPSAPISRNENGRPNLEFPQSGYQKGKDPYREPIE